MSRPLGDRILKVNHAGEHGAVNIYRGQILMARVTARAMRPELESFRADELRHRALFGAELQRRGCARCRSYWLCGIGGRVLGLVTGALGPGAIAATTVAVEHVVLGHLQRQMEALRGPDPVAAAVIAGIVEEEQRHHDESADRIAPHAFWMRVLAPVVAASTQAVIWVGMRL